MYAVIKTGGKQYRVEPGDTIYVEKLDLADGSGIDFEAMMFADGDDIRVGTPIVEGVTVNCKVIRQVKGKKVIIFKYKAKKNIRKKQGHRQKHTQLEISAIEA